MNKRTLMMIAGVVLLGATAHADIDCNHPRTLIEKKWCESTAAENYMARVSLPITLSLSTNGRILSVDELKVLMLHHLRRMASSEKSALFLEIEGLGFRSNQIRSDVTQGSIIHELYLGSLSVSFVSTVGQNLVVHLKGEFGIGGTMVMTKAKPYIDMTAYQDFLARECPGCTENMQPIAFSPTPMASMKMSLSKGKYWMSVDGRWLRMTPMQVDSYGKDFSVGVGGYADDRSGVVRLAFKNVRAGVEMGRSFLTGGRVMGDVFIRGEVQKTDYDQVNSLDGDANHNHSIGWGEHFLQEKTHTEGRSRPYIGIGVRFNIGNLF